MSAFGDRVLTHENQSKLLDEVYRWKHELEQAPEDSREFFEYIDSLNDTEKVYILERLVQWERVNGVVSDYFVHALTAKTIDRDYFLRAVSSLYGIRDVHKVMHPTIILLSNLDLIYPGELEMIIESIRSSAIRTILTDCADYLLVKSERNENLTAEQLVSNAVAALKRSLISETSTYIRCCATVSRTKTEELIRKLSKYFDVESLFEQTYLPNGSYMTGWMLLAEASVIRAGGKKLNEYNVQGMTNSTIKRLTFLAKMADSEV